MSRKDNLCKKNIILQRFYLVASKFLLNFTKNTLRDRELFERSKGEFQSVTRQFGSAEWESRVGSHQFIYGTSPRL